MGPRDRGLSRKQVLKQIDGSLKRLQTDYVDLYQCHRYDDNVALEETMQALTEVVAAGKARHIGFSEWPAHRIEEALQIPDVAKFVSSQPQYSALWRKPERDVIPVCERNGISQIVWSPLAQGVLTGKYKPGEKVPSDSRAANRTMNRFIKQWLGDDTLTAVQSLQPVADEAGVTLPQLALAWVLQPAERDRGDRRRDAARADRRERQGGGGQARRRDLRGDRRRAQNSGGVVSSGSIRQPSAAGGGVPELVEALLQRGRDQPPRHVAQARGGHDPLPRGVAPGGHREVHLDQVADHPEPRRPRGLHVARALAHGRVGVVDHERLPGLQAQLQERRLARPRAQQVHRDAQRGSRASDRGTGSSSQTPERRTGRWPPSRVMIS